jgi:CSLREA domain-containing protein
MAGVALVLLLSIVIIQAPPSLAAVLVVNSTSDRVDANPGDGICRTGQNVCSLRAAIQEANSLPGADTIYLPAGIFALEIPSINDDLPETGDFDIHGPVTIDGAGAEATIIDGGWPLPGANVEAKGMNRLFEIHPTAGNVTLLDVTLREAFFDGPGAAIQNWSPGVLRVERARIIDNLATGPGGGINNGDPEEYEWVVEPIVYPKSGRIEIVDSEISGNGSGSGGTAVNNQTDGTIVIENSQVVNNPGLMIPDPQSPQDPFDPEPPELIPAPGVYDPTGAAIVNEGAFDTGGTIRIVGSTVSGNYSTSPGGGILNDGDGTLVVENTTITDNTTEADGGGIYTTGGDVTIAASTITLNKAHDGGGLYSNGSTDKVGLRPSVSIVGGTISDNVAYAAGGGIHNGGETQFSMSDVTVDGNKAHDEGAGLAVHDRSTVNIVRTTFSDNEANGEGGGAWIGSERQATIVDSKFLRNHAGVPLPEDVFDPLGANIASGGGLYTEGGPISITHSEFAFNTATDTAGGVLFDNAGDIYFADSTVHDNKAATDGGGIENSGMRVTFERLYVKSNRAGIHGGGIYNSSSGEFFVLGTTIELNSALSGGGIANAPDMDTVIRGSLILRNTARMPGLAEDGDAEDGGLGGGIFSLADGDSLMENSTVSGNTAAKGGGGIFHDADGEFRMNNVTIWRNGAPRGGGIGVAESDFVPDVPPKANTAVIMRNSIIGGSLDGGSCDWYVTSEGGNLDTGGRQVSVISSEAAALPAETWCFLSQAPDSNIKIPAYGDRRAPNFTLDAIADNGGPTLSHALTYGNLAIDAGLSPCAEFDQRGVTRPQNGKCDTGAYEFAGAPPPPDSIAPDTQYLSGPVQDSLETVAFTFTGSDNLTPIDELMYECRLIEEDPTEPPEPPAPWDPIPVELWWVSCGSPFQAPLMEEGLFTFEVRAIDRAGNVDPTPAVHIVGGADTSPPQTLIADKPPALSPSRVATFTFSGVDNLTPAQFMEFECRLDSRDPELWLECFNPTIFSNLTSGQHTLEVRAYDGAENMDPTPARYTWTVGQLPNCDQANITLTPVADGWVDEVNPVENYLFETELTVRSSAEGGDPTEIPPEPIVGQNARTLIRFDLPVEDGCALESATLRLFNESPTEGRVLAATPLAGTWKESSLTWFNQPGVAGTPALSDPISSGEGYVEWDVLAHVEGMVESGVNHGWRISDAHESDPQGDEQSFASRETPQDPPPTTLPVLVLRYEAAGGPPPVTPTLPAGTQPTTVHCGQVLTQSTLVGNHLDCLGEGLVAGAPNIVIDLGGHTITNQMAVEAGEEEGLLSGIRNSGHANVVIRNGTIKNFGYGVSLTAGTTFNVVEDMVLDTNLLAGIALFDADDGRNGNTIRDNTLINNGESAITVEFGSENSRFVGNHLEGNGGVAFNLLEADGHVIEDNDVLGIPIDPNIDSDAGVYMESSRGNTIRNNRFSDFGDAGVLISMASHNNVVEGNTLTRSGDAGVSIADSNGTRIIDNVAHGSSDGGVVINNGNNTIIRGNDLRFNPSGVEASGANNLLIEDNDASHSLQAGFAIGNGVAIVIRNNTAHLTGGSGISMEGAAFDELGNPVGGALIEGNLTDENDESGITVAEGGHTIRNNTAFNNAGFGIEAGEPIDPQDPPDPNEPPNPAANIDGGGNVAAGNGEIAQCAGVVCASDEPPALTPIDLEGPDTTIVEMPANPTAHTSAVFAFGGTDNTTPVTAMSFECRLDPPPDPPQEPQEPDLEPPTPGEPPDIDTPETPGWIECSNPFRVDGLDQGTHVFQVRALDLYDNVDLTPAEYTWEVNFLVVDEGTEPETVPPDTRISSSPAAESTSTTATFAFAGSDNATPGLNLTFECSLDGGAWTACATPKTYAGLSLSSHTFQVRAIDRRGNVDPTPASHTWTVGAAPADTTPPDTVLDSQPDPVTVVRATTFTFHATEDGATFECRLDGGAWTACMSPHALEPAVGTHTFEVRAIDVAGNPDASPAAYTWKIGLAPVPTVIFCGQVIMQSIVARNDLVDCLWDGLVVGAPDITIDLDGHTIDGKGIAAGIRVDGHDNVTIKNGLVKEFDWGVMINPNTSGNVVEELHLELNQEAAVGLGHPPHKLDMLAPDPEEPLPNFDSKVIGNTIRNNDIVANDRGVWLTNQARNNVIVGNSMAANAQNGVWLERARDNRVEANEITASSGAAIALNGATGNLVLGNILPENGGGIELKWTETAPVGIQSDNNRIEDNTIAEASGPGIEVYHSDGNQVVGNSVHFANGDGVEMDFGRETLILQNDLTLNKGGISLKNSSDNRIELNDASESEGTGIDLQAMSIGNDLIRNISSNNDGDGIYVGDEVPGTSGILLDGNTTNNNKGYGIFVPKVSHVIKNNRAYDNGGWGIWVSEGSNGRFNIDGGGNVALGNLGPIDPLTQMPMQCHVVRCEGAPPANFDLITPETLILQMPTNPSVDPTATFTFNGTDNAGDVTFQCSLDGGAFDPCPSPAVFPNLAIGPHTLAVRAVDLSGNVDTTPATYSWAIQAAPGGAPDTTIDKAPNNVTVDTAASFEFRSTMGGSTFECSLDGATFAACASPKVYTGLAVGDHQFRVRAVAPGGTPDPAPANHQWTIGTAPVPAAVGCGEIIIRSTLVTNDLINCQGHALIIGASGITIDFDGHMVDGVGLDAGVLNNGHDALTLRNGIIHEFDFGVLLNPGTSLNVIEGMRFELNQEAGVTLSDADQGGDGNVIRGNLFTSNEFGLAIHSNTSGARIYDNEFASNFGDAIRLEHSLDALIEHNEIVNSSGAGVIMEGGSGHIVRHNSFDTNLGPAIAIGEELIPTNGVLVEHNEIIEGVGGILVSSSDGAQIRYNIVRGTSGPGVTLELATHSVVRGNDLRGNQGGIAVEESTDNLIEANNASEQLGSGIEIGSLSFDNIVRGNTASLNGGEGIQVEDSAPNGRENVIEDNVADGNGGDGISIEGVGVILARNTAKLNGGWGIYVAAGATNLGGNIAAGNQEPAQCFGITCNLGFVPGAPETWIVEGPADADPATPGVQTHSRNASFTYNAEDDVSLITEITFECRFDTSNDLAWEDCEYPAEYLNLSPGQHVFEVRALDLQLMADSSPARFEFTYVPLPAGVAPEITLDIVPEPETWVFDALFTFHANEPDVTFQCQVDQFGWEPCGFEEPVSFMSMGAFEWSLEETDIGLHTFRVRAIDFEGNVSTPKTYTWRLLGVRTIITDGPGFTPGETPFEPPTGGEVLSSNATFVFESNVADATFECSLDLAPFAPCSSPLTFTGLLQGDHMLTIIAIDANGIEELEPVPYEWEVAEFQDTTPPTVSIERAPLSGTSDGVFEFIGADDMTPPALLTYECRVDSTNDLDWEECVSPFTLLDLYTYDDPQMAPGQHTFQVRAIDIAEPLDPNSPFEGNVGAPASYTWIAVADTTPPTTGILSGPSGTVGEVEMIFEFFGGDNATPLLGLVFECSLDGGPYEECQSPESLSGVAPGEHTLRIRAVDLAGNPDPTPAQRTWIVAAMPVVTITSGPAGRIIDGAPEPIPGTAESAIFVFSSDQPGSTFECSLDGGDFLPCTSPAAMWVVESGSHEFAVRAINPQLVVGEETTYEWLVLLGPDATRPNTFVVAGPNRPFDTRDVATFAFSGSDNRTQPIDLRFECALDGTAFNSCVSPQQFSDLTHGSHTLLVRAIDLENNVDASPAVYSWSVELPPVTTITSGPPEIDESQTATFVFGANVPGSTYTCWLDVAMAPCTSPVTYTSLAAGEHLFAVIAKGPGGSQEHEWVEWEWVIGETSRRSRRSPRGRLSRLSTRRRASCSRPMSLTSRSTARSTAPSRSHAPRRRTTRTSGPASMSSRSTPSARSWSTRSASSWSRSSTRSRLATSGRSSTRSRRRRRSNTGRPPRPPAPWPGSA